LASRNMKEHILSFLVYPVSFSKTEKKLIYLLENDVFDFHYE